MFRRAVFSRLWQRIEEPRRFIQILAGPRQTGKTTIARQVREAADMPVRYASADEPTLKDPPWIEQQWESARLRLRSEGAAKALLILDEIQKIPEWSETVKRLWDEDSATSTPLHVVLLGSSPLLTYRGLSDSLAGRFEILPVTHWGYPEMREAFGWSVDQYVYFGGYPGAAGLIGEPDRWRRYILDALIEPSVSRDILLMTRVDKPALLRRLFELGCVYSGRILSYQKMTGQLQDAGNTTTLAHYLHLLQGAGLLVGLHKYAGERVRQRGSSPKLLVMNTALFSAFSGKSFEEARTTPDFWGRLVESAVGGTLANAVIGTGTELFYWAGKNREVDFVLRRGDVLMTVEVKSGRRKDTLPGMAAFAKEFPVTHTLLVGADGIPLEEFLSQPIDVWTQ